MKCLVNEDLSKYTTVRIGGTAKKMFVPENEDELLKVIEEENPKYFIGGGSNLLIDEDSFDTVVNLRNFNTQITELGDGLFSVGASVRLQKLITTINEKGFGGIEYLFSVPGLVGGAVVMNAGRGKKANKCISDYIVNVRVLENGKILELKKEECDFSYRNSRFKNGNAIVLSVLFKFPSCGKDEAEKLRKERIEHCKKVQDNSAPNFGSVFSSSSMTIMKLVKKIGIRSGGCRFSGKTVNWILNTDNGTYADASKCIRKVQRLHRLCGKKCKLEVILWEGSKNKE